MREGSFNRGQTWADLKCEGKEPSVKDRLIIDVIGVIKMSIQSFTRLVGIGHESKSEDLHGDRRTRRSTSSAVPHELDSVKPSWCEEGSTLVSVSLRGRKNE